MAQGTRETFLKIYIAYRDFQEIMGVLIWGDI